jgi:hypothetical protein
MLNTEIGHVGVGKARVGSRLSVLSRITPLAPRRVTSLFLRVQRCLGRKSPS